MNFDQQLNRANRWSFGEQARLGTIFDCEGRVSREAHHHENHRIRDNRARCCDGGQYRGYAFECQKSTAPIFRFGAQLRSRRYCELLSARQSWREAHLHRQFDEDRRSVSRVKQTPRVSHRKAQLWRRDHDLAGKSFLGSTRRAARSNRAREPDRCSLDLVSRRR
jgi:hypothetical protein